MCRRLDRCGEGSCEHTARRGQGYDSAPIRSERRAHVVDSPAGVTRSESAGRLHVSTHPAVLHKLALLRDEHTEPKKFRELVREIAGCSATRRWPMPAWRPCRCGRRSRRSRRQRAGRPHRPRAHPARRPGHGRRDARADAHRRGMAPGPVPRRAHAAAGRVLQQAARLGDGRPVPDPRPDARDRRLGHGRHRGAQAAGAPRASSSST